MGKLKQLKYKLFSPIIPRYKYACHENIKFPKKVLELYNALLKETIIQFRKVEFDDAKNIYDFSLKQKDVEYPYSCTMEEGLIIMDIILKNKLKSGYEIATAFGVSSWFAGLAFSKTKGFLQTIDCYIEETKNDFLYSNEDILNHIKELNKNVSKGLLPKGLEIAKINAEKLNIEENIEYILGVSPQDVITNIETDLDFVFIDGGHFGEQPTIDFESVKAKINKKKCALFFHDNNNNEATLKAINKAEEYFKVKAIDLNTHWHLTVIPIGIRL